MRLLYAVSLAFGQIVNGPTRERVSRRRRPAGQRQRAASWSGRVFTRARRTLLQKLLPGSFDNPEMCTACYLAHISKHL